MRSKFQQLGKESIIYGLGGLTGRFLGFLLLPVYTRIFSPADYGVLDVIATMTALAGIVLTAGSDSALSYYFYKDNSFDQRRRTATTSFLQVFAINLLVATFVWIFAYQIAGATFEAPAHGRVLRIAVISLPFTGLTTANLNLLRLQRRPWAYVFISISRLIVTLGLNFILVVYLRIGVMGVFWSNLVASVGFSICGLIVNREYVGRYFDWSRLRQLVRFGAPLIIGGLSMWIINYLDRYFLLNYASLEEVGIYSVARRLASVIVLVTMAFRTANLAFQYESMDDEQAPEIYSRTLTYFVLVTSLLVVPLSLFARPILMVMTTEEFVEAYKAVPFLAYAAAGYGLYQIVGIGLLITKHTTIAGATIAAGALITVVLLFLLVPPLGIIGAAIATLLTHVGVVVLRVLVGNRFYPIPYDFGRVLRTLLASSIVIGAGLLLQLENLWLTLLYALGLTLLYPVLLLLLSAVKTSEIMFAKRSAHRLAIDLGFDRRNKHKQMSQGSKSL